MDYDLQCLLTALISTIFLALAIFLGIFINKLFALFIIGFPIPLIVMAIKYND